MTSTDQQQPARYLLDDDGDLWRPGAHDLWRTNVAENTADATRETIEDHYGPVVELVPATRVAELESRLDDAEQSDRNARAMRDVETARAAALEQQLAGYRFAYENRPLAEKWFTATDTRLDEMLTLLLQLAAPPKLRVGDADPGWLDWNDDAAIADALSANLSVPASQPRAEAPQAGSGDLRAESGATQNERRLTVQRDAARQYATDALDVLRTVLSNFATGEKGHPGVEACRTHWINVGTIAGWQQDYQDLRQLLAESSGEATA